MVDTAKLRGLIVERGLSQQAVARGIGVSPRTFYARMKNGVFNTNEIELMISMLSIRNPGGIFFAPAVAHYATFEPEEEILADGT